MSKQLYKAIIFFPKETLQTPIKYRNVKDDTNFIKFISNKGAWYVNLYDQQTGNYIKRIYTNN